MTKISGRPQALRDYTDTVVPGFAALRTAIEDAGQALDAYSFAPSEMGMCHLNQAGQALDAADAMEDNDRLPAAFARALEMADAEGMLAPDGTVRDPALFAALVESARILPDSSDLAVWNAAMDALAEELAGEMSDLIDDVDVDRDDIEALQDDLLIEIGNLRQAYAYSSDPNQRMPSDSELVAEAMERLGYRWDPPLDEDQLARLADITSSMQRYSSEPSFARTFYQELGPDKALDAAELAGYAAWSEALGAEADGPSAQVTIRAMGQTLGVASRNGLGAGYLDRLIGGGIDDHKLNDALPALLASGEFSHSWAVDIGDLGVDIIDGESGTYGSIEVDKGVGSPFFDGWDVAETSWQERGSTLLATTARTPSAANVVVQEHAVQLTDSDFGDRDGSLWAHHNTDYDAISHDVNSLLVAATVTYAHTNPTAAAEAAIDVMNGAVADAQRNDGIHSDAAEALAPAYAEMSLQYLDDLGLSSNDTDGLVVDDDRILGGVLPKSRFLALALNDEAGRTAIMAEREVLISRLTVLEDLTNGVDLGNSSPAVRIGTMDGILQSAFREHDLAVASEQAAAAADFNERVDLVRDLVLDFAPTSRIPAPGATLGTHAVGELTDDLLHRPTNQVAVARVDLTEGQYELSGSRNETIASTELTMAAAHQANGHDLTGRQELVLGQARKKLTSEYVDQLVSQFAPGAAPGEIDDLDPDRFYAFRLTLEGTGVMSTADERANTVEADLPEALFEG